MRRQKCDRKDPCTRCIQNNEASSCSRKWQDGYDPRLHRTYPKSKEARSSESTTAPGPIGDRLPQNGCQDASLMQGVAPMRRDSPSYPTFRDITNPSRPQALSASRFADNVQRTAPSDFRHSQSQEQPIGPAFSASESTGSSDLGQYNVRPSLDARINAENPIQMAENGYVDARPNEIERQRLQNLIPSRIQMIQLVDYHEAYLLWYLNCIHGPTFRMELNKALEAPEGVQLKTLDLQWSALLFAILAASIVCTSHSVAHSWGFSKAQKRHLSIQWYEAAISCLQLGDYTARPNVYSIQTIQVLSMSAHTIGFSNKQFVLFGAALKIAQNLGLQRLDYDPDLDEITAGEAGITLSRNDVLIRRETGRRIWAQLCTVDWFSIPSSNMYSINKQHFTTSKPRKVDNETTLSAEGWMPLAIDFGNLLYDIASLLAQFHDSVITLSDPAAKYDQVLKYDSRMRALSISLLSYPYVDEFTSRPPWTRWVKGVVSIVQAHKIIMIHRGFLAKSFTDPRYAYTRWASVAASKTVLREAHSAATDPEKPILWHDQVCPFPICFRD